MLMRNLMRCFAEGEAAKLNKVFAKLENCFLTSPVSKDKSSVSVTTEIAPRQASPSFSGPTQATVQVSAEAHVQLPTGMMNRSGAENGQSDFTPDPVTKVVGVGTEVYSPRNE